MADDVPPPSPEDEAARQAAIKAKRIANLKPIAPGEVRNPRGSSSWQRAQARISEFMSAAAERGSDTTRMDRLLLAVYTSALKPGPQGAADRKLLVEQCAGKAKQQVDLTNEDGTILPAVIRICPVAPREEIDDAEKPTESDGT